jgi:hypothetical protein
VSAEFDSWLRGDDTPIVSGRKQAQPRTRQTTHLHKTQKHALAGAWGVVSGQPKEGKVRHARKPLDRCFALTDCVSIMPDGTESVFTPTRTRATRARDNRKTLRQQQQDKRMALLASVGNNSDVD